MKLVCTLLIIGIVIIFFPDKPIPVLDITIPQYWVSAVKFIYFVCLFLSLHWLYQEFNEKGGLHKITVKVISNFIHKVTKRGAKKIENLIEIYGDKINPEKDIYFVNDTMVVKTGNITNNGHYEPCGYVINCKKNYYYRILFMDYTAALFHKDIGKYAACFIVAMLLVIAQLIFILKKLIV